MYLGDLADQSFELFIILGPFLHRRFELAGNVEGDGFACLLPGEEEDGMFRSVVVASAALFPTLSRGSYKAAFDPGAEVLQLAEQGLAFGLEL